MKPGMSTFQMVLLAVFGTFAVASVLIFAFFIGTDSSSSTGPVVIWGTFDESAFSAVLRQLVETDSRLRQVTYIQKDPTTFRAELANGLASGNGPDLFILRHDETVTEAAKIYPIPYEQLSRETFRNYWVEAADPFLGTGGVLGVPFAVDPFVLYWNRDMLSTAGVARAPQFWEEVYELTRTATRKNDSGSITKSAVAFGEYSNVNHAKSVLSMLMMQAGGRVTARDSAGTLLPVMTARVNETSQPGDSALRFYTQFSNPTSPDYSWNRSMPEARTAFAQGDLAIYLGPASEEPLIRRLNPNLNFAIATSVPQVKGADRNVNTGFAYAFAVPLATKNLEGALTAAYILAAPEGSKTLALAFGIASARRDVLAEPAQGNDAVFNKMALLVRTWEDPNPQETDRIFKDMIESVTSGAARTLEAVQRADQAMRALSH
jgi:ABC-type glycerol-3-phosphate transport system substrate-binding protein